MSGAELDLDELFAAQRASARTATLEEVADDANAVKVTPYVTGHGCACDQAITIPRTELTSIIDTGETHFCCGHRLLVVKVSFANDTVSQIFDQAMQKASHVGHSAENAMGRSTAPTYGAQYARWPRFPNQRFSAPIVQVQSCTEQCQFALAACLSTATSDFDACMCRNSWRLCQGSCTGHTPPLQYCPPPY